MSLLIIFALCLGLGWWVRSDGIGYHGLYYRFLHAGGLLRLLRWAAAICIVLGYLYSVGQESLDQKEAEARGSDCSMGKEQKSVADRLISGFGEEHPNAVSHYDELNRYIDTCHQDIEDYTRERDALSSETGRQMLTQQIQALQSDINVMEQNRQHLVRVATERYFMRMMEELGIRLDSSTADRDMQQVLLDVSDTVVREKQKQQTKKR